jgi:spore coat protein U-like protein
MFPKVALPPRASWSAKEAGARARRRIFALSAVGLVGVLAGGLPAAAATATTTYTVSTTVQATCSVSAGNMAFGAYSGAAVTADASLSITCTNTTPYIVGLSAGVGAGGTTTTRQMTGPGAATLGYQMFRDGALTQNWGNTAGTDTQAGAGNGVAQVLTVYGQIAAGQAVTPGPYADTITVTVTY